MPDSPVPRTTNLYQSCFNWAEPHRCNAHCAALNDAVLADPKWGISKKTGRWELTSPEGCCTWPAYSQKNALALACWYEKTYPRPFAHNTGCRA